MPMYASFLSYFGKVVQKFEVAPKVHPFAPLGLPSAAARSSITSSVTNNCIVEQMGEELQPEPGVVIGLLMGGLQENNQQCSKMVERIYVWSEPFIAKSHVVQTYTEQNLGTNSPGGTDGTYANPVLYKIAVLSKSWLKMHLPFLPFSITINWWDISNIEAFFFI